MVSVTIDLHCNILSAQCFFKCKISESISKIEINVNSDCLCMLLWNGSVIHHQLKILSPYNFFIPTTFSCIKYNDITKNVFTNNEGDAVMIDYEIQKLTKVTNTANSLVFETSFRLQVLNHNVIKSCIDESHIVLKGDFLRNKIQNNVPYDIICTSCNSMLTSQPLRFESVLDYHEEISELSETWFCHKHSEHSTVQNSRGNSDVKLYTLYIGELFFYFHNAMIELMSLEKLEKEYRCKKCSSLLSAGISSSSKYIGFFSDEIMLKSTKYESESPLQYRKSTALLCFSHLIETHMQSSMFCKLFFESKVADENICLLLWITSQKVAQVSFHDMMIEDVTEISMNAKEVYKVFYCISSPESDVVKSWKHDFNVDFFLISNNTMKIITELLKESSQFIPAEEGNVKSFTFGYLPSYPLHV